MSCLENNTLVDRLIEAFEIAITNDRELQNELAVLFLDHQEYYQYCKEDRSELLHDREDEIYEKIEECFFNHDKPCFDIRELAEEAFNIKLGEK